MAKGGKRSVPKAAKKTFTGGAGKMPKAPKPFKK